MGATQRLGSWSGTIQVQTTQSVQPVQGTSCQCTTWAQEAWSTLPAPCDLSDDDDDDDDDDGGGDDDDDDDDDDDGQG